MVIIKLEEILLANTISEEIEKTLEKYNCKIESIVFDYNTENSLNIKLKKM
ncbi:MAG: hypothetical protein ACRDAQ_09210 [Cetobacterium sp.]